MREIGGIVFAGAVALLAWRLRGLTASGALAAFVVGACTFIAGSWAYAAVLFAFFIPSMLLSRIGRERKRRLVDIGKSGARDAWQVFANGGVAAIFAVLAGATRNTALAAAFAGAFAAASADTWATEIGTMVNARPRSILTLRTLEPGMSGGITVAGTLAQAAGACALAAAAWAVGIGPWRAVAAAGFAGALIDSILGASLQELRYCPACERTCETNPHVCGASTRLVRGRGWVTNDTVNACATAAGALIALVLASR